MPSFTVFKGNKEGKIYEQSVTRELGATQVFVKTTHSGLCGTDEHYKNADMGLGHEGVGVVEEVGSAVTILKKGDIVGWGYQHNSCGHCKQCLTGYETLCPERAMYGYNNLDQGSFSYGAVWESTFLFKVPSAISPEHAAPLMCGGATVYNALSDFGIRPAHRVGILGIGGLGHLAIQFAAKMGCQVVVFSSTESKKAEALSLGATEFHATKDVKDLSNTTAPIDALLVCASVQPDWAQFLPILAPNATIFPLTVSMDNFVIPYMPLITSQLRIQGSLVAARQVHREMLEFAAVHGIKPMVEKFPMSVDGIEAAYKKLGEGKMRYRGVCCV